MKRPLAQDDPALTLDATLGSGDAFSDILAQVQQLFKSFQTTDEETTQQMMAVVEQTMNQELEAYVERGRTAVRKRVQNGDEFAVLNRWSEALLKKLPPDDLRTTILSALSLRQMLVFIERCMEEAPADPSLFPGLFRWLSDLSHVCVTFTQKIAQLNTDSPTLYALITGLLCDAALSSIRTLHLPPIQNPAVPPKKMKFNEKVGGQLLSFITDILANPIVLNSVKSNIVKTFARLLADNIFADLSWRPGVKAAVGRIVSFCFNRALEVPSGPQELDYVLFVVMAVWKEIRIEGVADLTAELYGRLNTCVEELENSREYKPNVSASGLGQVLHFIAVWYSLGTDTKGSLHAGYRTLTVDIQEHFQALERLASVSRRSAECFLAVCIHLTELLETSADISQFSTVIGRVVQKLFVDGQDASTLFPLFAAHYGAIRCTSGTTDMSLGAVSPSAFEQRLRAGYFCTSSFRDDWSPNPVVQLLASVSAACPSVWFTASESTIGASLFGEGGIRSLHHEVKLGFRVKHRLLSLLRKLADVVCGKSPEQLSAEGEQDGPDRLLGVMNDRTHSKMCQDILKSLIIVHTVVGAYGKDETENELVAVSWWLYNGLNADLASDNVGYTLRAISLYDKQIIQQVDVEKVATHLQRLRRILFTDRAAALYMLLLALGCLTNVLLVDRLVITNPHSVFAAGLNGEHQLVSSLAFDGGAEALAQAVATPQAYLPSIAVLCHMWKNRIFQSHVRFRVPQGTRDLLRLLERKTSWVSSKLSSTLDLSTLLPEPIVAEAPQTEAQLTRSSEVIMQVAPTYPHDQPTLPVDTRMNAGPDMILGPGMTGGMDMGVPTVGMIHSLFNGKPAYGYAQMYAPVQEEEEEQESEEDSVNGNYIGAYPNPQDGSADLVGQASNDDDLADEDLADEDLADEDIGDSDDLMRDGTDLIESDQLNDGEVSGYSDNPYEGDEGSEYSTSSHGGVNFFG
ncbi:hypothetical protein GNI_020240 [Gregarina niphandrodes]|uniref:Uncharacterized protein n=1 Tax=Gregarina niphandrodes TaxID=110365 RepID=A0A023BC00_GRENI|nr:hypothetical protein GNI_020240 [Gregarina niphandrodes]EZG81074.1 hypothetical protein GNI_020240 [Gregarina niphandrodes]|eukprot:XP_011134270.1 hypothetical protein GNI_020240 [Gregarina niphandrodes]